jgi:rhamnulokinase
MSGERRHVAVDLGASGGRVALGTIRDGRLDVEILHRFPNGGVPIQGGLYWDHIGLWREILRGLKLAGERGSVVSVGVNSWGVDYALLDEYDLVIDGVRHYRDARTDGAMERLFNKIPSDRLYAATGIQFMQLNTIFQLFAQMERTPGHLARATSALMFPDLLHFWLSGKKVAEISIASTSQMVDPLKRVWSEEIMEELGLRADLFPPTVEPGTILGPVADEIAEQTGLHGASVIVPAAHDTGSAVAAVPAAGTDGWAYISSGTWSLVGVESPHPVINAQTTAQNLTNEAGIKGTTRLLKNVMGLWILQECRRAWGNHDYPELYAEAEALPSGGPTIDPDDLRFLHPSDDMPGLVRGWCRENGLRIPDSRGEITRCVLDSLAHRSAQILDGLQQVTGQRIHTVHIVGGGSQIEFLNQLIADSSGRTVVAGPVEATLIGNLLIQAEAAGSIDPGSIRNTVRESVELKRYEPGGVALSGKP